jgi:hypothetical protein
MTRIEGIEIVWPPGGEGSEGKAEIRVRSHLETRFFVLFPYAYETDWVNHPLPEPAGRKEP